MHTDEKKKESRLKFKRSSVAVEEKPENIELDSEYSFSKLSPLSVAPYYATSVMDPALSPAMLKQAYYEDVTCAKWSPVGCDRTGRCAN